MSSRTTAPAIRTDRRSGPGPAVLLVALLVLATITVPVATLAQDDATTRPAISIDPRQAIYGPGESVQLTVTNEGKDPIRGDVEIRVLHEDGCTTRCPSAEATHVITLRETDVTLKPGQNLTQIWGRNTASSETDRAPAGTYYARVVWEATDGSGDRATDTSGPFELETTTDQAGSDGAPVIRILSPNEGLVYPAGPVRVDVVFEDDQAVASAVVWLGGKLLLNEHPGKARFTFSEEVKLPAGEHQLLVNATDTDQRFVQRQATVVVKQMPASQLLVTTDRPAYGQGEAVRIHVRNTGTTNLSGTPSLQVQDAQGNTLWAPAMTQEVLTLEPREERVFPWRQVDDQGDPVPPGTYTIHASWGETTGRTQIQIAPDRSRFTLHLTAPDPGAGVQETVRLGLSVNEPGAATITFTITDGQTELTRTRSFDEPATGTVRHSADLTDASPGIYTVRVEATGPGGTAHATTWFRLLPSQDTQPPVLQVIHPEQDATIPRVFPIVLQADDDQGITYAEATIGDQLIGRHAWPAPVERGVLLARVPAELTGPQALEVTVYDPGEHSDTQAIEVTIEQTTQPCTRALIDARAMAQAAIQRHQAARPAVANASIEAGLALECPGDQAPKATQGSGDFRYARDRSGTLVDVHVRGKPLIERITTQDGDQEQAADLPAPATRGRFMVFEGQAKGNVSWDLNASWIAIQRGGHVILENTEDGSRILLVSQGSVPRVLGHRVTAATDPSTRLVLRPLSGGPVDERLADGIIEGRVGAEVVVQDQGTDSVSYSDLDVDVTTGDNRVEATLSSQRHEGRTVVFTLAEEAGVDDGIEVLVDGEPIEPADSLEDVLGPADPDQPSTYHVVQDQGETKVILKVNHFSTRDVVIQTLEAVEPFIRPIAVIGGLAIVVAAAAGLFRREEM